MPRVTQAAALEALTGDQGPQQDAYLRYRTNRDRLVSALNALPGVECPLPPGGMFAFPSVAGLVGDGSGCWSTSAELAAWLLDTADVAVVPGEAYDAPGPPAPVLRRQLRHAQHPPSPASSRASANGVGDNSPWTHSLGRITG